MGSCLLLCRLMGLCNRYEKETKGGIRDSLVVSLTLSGTTGTLELTICLQTRSLSQVSKEDSELRNGV